MGRDGCVTSLDEFRDELRSWLGDNLTEEVVRAGSRPIEGANLEELQSWNRTLADGRWAAPSWPVEHGGRGAGVDEQLVYLEEMNRVRAPGPLNVIGVSNIAPAIMHFGTPEQKDRFLTPMLRGDEIWSQGMSEPDAGSDLAALRTQAVEDGDDFVINGQKTWNSMGHFADWCQLYVRTDPTAKKHRGITCFLVDLTTAGIEARPLTTITGGQSFAELFFADVRVPRSAMLGSLHEGWGVAMTTLSYERAGVARLHLGLANKLDDLLADPRAGAGCAIPGYESASPVSTPTSRACAFSPNDPWPTPRPPGPAAAWPNSLGLTATRSWRTWRWTSSVPRHSGTAGGRICWRSARPRSPAGRRRSTATSWPNTSSGCLVDPAGESHLERIPARRPGSTVHSPSRL